MSFLTPSGRSFKKIFACALISQKQMLEPPPQTRYMGIVNHLTYGYLDPNLGFLQDISNFQLVLLMEEDRGNPLF